MKQKRSPETLEALKSLIKNDIIGSVNENLWGGNITLEHVLKDKGLVAKDKEIAPLKEQLARLQVQQINCNLDKK